MIDPNALLQPPGPIERCDPERSRSLSVLVADDYASTAQSLATLLNLVGYKARATFSGRAAINAAQAEWPDVVLMDIAMPGMTGYQLAKRIRELSVNRPKPLLVVISGNINQADQQQAMDEGMDAFFPKPTDPQLLVEWLDQQTAARL